jgi:hypothetical protein
MLLQFPKTRDLKVSAIDFLTLSNPLTQRAWEQASQRTM